LLDDSPEDFEENEKEEEQPNKGGEALNEIIEEEEYPNFKFDVVESKEE
jgi:hypothetical protein